MRDEESIRREWYMRCRIWVKKYVVSIVEPR